MSDLRTEIVSKVLNSWDAPPPQVEVQDQSITRKVFDFVDNNPSCTINDIVAGVGVDLGRASATTLAMYQRGKLDRKLYPNPDPNGKRPNVYVYWTAVNNFSDAGVRRLMKPKKQKKPYIHKALANLEAQQEGFRPPPRMKQVADSLVPTVSFNPEMFVQDLSLKDAKAVYEILKGYFGD
jgi:hypothetical protein